MKMQGGGKHKIAPGQVTDNGELSLMLLNSLLIYDSNKSLKDQVPAMTILIAFSYIMWIKTEPKITEEGISNGIQSMKFNLEDI